MTSYTHTPSTQGARNAVESLARVFDAIQATDTGDTWLTTHAERAAHYPNTLPEHALRFDTFDAMRRRVSESGSHYFDRDTIRWFRAKSHPATTPSGLYASRFWVESVQHRWTDYRTGETTTEPRQYRVCWVEHPSTTSEILSVGRLGEYGTLREARAYARALADSVAAVEREHSDYPHHPGRLYDCPACEARCWCVTPETEAPCIWGAEDTPEPAHHGTREAREQWRLDHADGAS
jgi:hypothetical protein